MRRGPTSQRTVPIPSDLGTRIGEVFSLEGPPGTLSEFGALSSRRWPPRLRDSALDGWFRDVSSGKAIFGGVNRQTRQRARLRNGREAYTACALDALIEGLFQPTEIESACFHCNQSILIRMSGGTIRLVRPSTVVMWLGASKASDEGAACACETDACPYINFFASKVHASDWRRKNPEEPGMVLTLRQSLGLARKGWWEPVHQSLASAKAGPAHPRAGSLPLNVVQ
jgi:Alkylmercury lyase